MADETNEQQQAPAQEIDLKSLNRAELIAHAESVYGLASLSGTKAEILAAIADAKTVSKYHVLRPIEHDKKLYPVGGEISLNNRHAEPLLTSQAIKVATKEVPLT